MYRLIALAIALVLAGCAAPPQLTREQWLSMTNRTYTGVSKEQALAAAERLFVLADGDDFKFTHSDDGLVATRAWSIFMLLAATVGTDTWQVKARPTTDGVQVSASVYTHDQAVGMLMAPGGAVPLTSAQVGYPVQGTAIYDVFWARMDYLLGRRADWMDCNKANARVDSKIVIGPNNALCSSINTKDSRPEGPMLPMTAAR